MKENKSKVIITSIVTVFPMVIGFLLWNRLPEKIATHFGSEGADGWSTKLFAVVIFPLILLVIHLFCLGVTLNDPKKKNIGRAMMTLIFWIVPVLSVVSLIFPVVLSTLLRQTLSYFLLDRKSVV